MLLLHPLLLGHVFLVHHRLLQGLVCSNGWTPWIPWTLETPGFTQGVPRSSSDPHLVPPQFKKPRTPPPPRTVVATTRTEMYMRHTSQDVTVTSPTPGLRRRHACSSSTSSGSRIPGPPQTSPRSSVQQWLDALDTQVPPPVIPVSQPVSLHSAVTSSMPLGYLSLIHISEPTRPY